MDGYGLNSKSLGQFPGFLAINLSEIFGKEF